MLHPVGPRSAAVYWRRRLLVLSLLLSVLGGGGWLGVTLLGRHPVPSTLAAAAATSTRTVATRTAATPALEQVVPALGTPAAALPTRAAASSLTAAPTSAPAAGGPCSDAMLGLQVRVPASAAAGARSTFQLVVTNLSAVPCVRALDAGLQELLLLDAAGDRVWDSADCAAADPADSRTLAPGEAVAFPLVWNGLTSEPTCTAAPKTPPPGSYTLRGRLDTLTSPDVAVALT